MYNDERRREKGRKRQVLAESIFVEEKNWTIKRISNGSASSLYHGNRIINFAYVLFRIPLEIETSAIIPFDGIKFRLDR